MMSPSSIIIPPVPVSPRSPPSPPHTPPSPRANITNSNSNSNRSNIIDSAPINRVDVDEPSLSSPSPVPESTFKTYTPSQATTYAERRKGYSPNLYNYILTHHRSTGGENNILLDVGCGPGIVTRDLAGEFDTVIGVDSGREMINAAERLGGITSTRIVTRCGKDIRYFVGEAEGVDEIDEVRRLVFYDDSGDGDGSQKGGVDLVTAGTAAHWFDMPKFWESTARIVKPGGTVALWSLPNIHCHPSTPNANKIQTLLNSFRDNILKPYMLPPSLLNANMYRGIPLPWDSHTTAPYFDRHSFIHRIWDEPPSSLSPIPTPTPLSPTNPFQSHSYSYSHFHEQTPDSSPQAQAQAQEQAQEQAQTKEMPNPTTNPNPIITITKKQEQEAQQEQEKEKEREREREREREKDSRKKERELFFTGTKRFTLSSILDSAVTMNSVTRWREAHPDLAETEQDVVYQLVEQLRKTLGWPGGDDKPLDDIWIEAGMSTVLVLVKRNAVVFPT